MSFVLHPANLLLVLLRSWPRALMAALMAAPMNAAIAARVGQLQRATFLSLQSLVGRLAFAGFLLVLSVAGPAGEEAAAWTGLSVRLRLAAAVGLVALVVLTASTRLLRTAGE